LVCDLLSVQLFSSFEYIWTKIVYSSSFIRWRIRWFFLENTKVVIVHGLVHYFPLVRRVEWILVILPCVSQSIMIYQNHLVSKCFIKQSVICITILISLLCILESRKLKHHLSHSLFLTEKLNFNPKLLLQK